VEKLLSSDILYSNVTIVFFFIEFILVMIQFVALVYSLIILKNWNFNLTTSYQYKLEKTHYLVTLIIYFSVVSKIILYPYFSYTLDQLSLIIPGAMCGAGVISSNIYGEKLLFLKTITIFIGFIWLKLNSIDIEKKNFPYIKHKLYLFIFLFSLFLLETIFDILFFMNLTTYSPVSCCSTIYSTIENPLPFSISLDRLILSFYVLFFITIITSIKKRYILTAVSNIIFIYLSYYSVVYFFGTYIYQQPTHHCPFCMLQKEYFYIGYFIFGTLFLGTLFGILNFITYLLTKEKNKKYYSYSILFNSVFVGIVTGYVLVYYLTNGVFL
jgi:hypothetical protein